MFIFENQKFTFVLGCEEKYNLKSWQMIKLAHNKENKSNMLKTVVENVQFSPKQHLNE